MTDRRPIEIVGGGLAGLALGLALRRSEVPVTVLEAGKYPRHRVCGEFISGLSEETIDRLGLGGILDGALSHSRVAWFIRERLARTQTLPSPALGLSRYALDARLAQAFAAAGGALQTGVRVAEPTSAAGRVVATGRRRSRSPWIGLKVHARGLALASDLELHLGEDAYVGLSGVENGRVNICGFFRRRAMDARGWAVLPAYLRSSGLTALAARIEQAAIDTESFCAVAALAVDRAVGRRRFACLGDACAMTPPFTGNGMAMAFQSAETALGPLTAYSRGDATWADTTARIHSRLRDRFRLRLASASVLHPYLLRPPRQRWLAALNRARVLPIRTFFALLH
jgi:2-polyprenyl-6-methoxyphenol hydroxylase-like FAD-dependent oxidoreductase